MVIGAVVEWEETSEEVIPMVQRCSWEKHLLWFKQDLEQYISMLVPFL